MTYLQDAARFLIDNNDCIDWQMIIAMLKVTLNLASGQPHGILTLSLQDCRVDERGKAILAPQWADEVYDFDAEREELKYHLDQFLSLHVS